MSDKPEIPVSMSFEELEKLAKSRGKKSSTKKKSRATPTEADKDTTLTSQPEIVPSQIYKVLHYYTRPNDTFSAVKREASDEVSYHNINVRVCTHAHEYGASCTDQCQIIQRKE